MEDFFVLFFSKMITFGFHFGQDFNYSLSLLQSHSVRLSKNNQNSEKHRSHYTGGTKADGFVVTKICTRH